MKIVLAIKQTDEQKRANDYARFQFIMAMMNMDYFLMKTLLKKNCFNYLGSMNEWQFCSWLENKFKPLRDIGFHSRYKEQICLDVCPGAEMYLFEYTEISENEELDSNPFEKMEALNQPKKEALKLALVPLFENGKITGIRVPTKGIEVDIMKKLQCRN